ncbi:MAG: riboflavin synthase [Verrucomicrobia bacterium]|nr:riboflavin synthase [Verrucomicrobiota bacterium]
MFTGIVEEAGRVQRIDFSPKAIRLAVSATVCGVGLKEGDSVAVNGCCLTAVKIRKGKREASIEFDLLEETWNRTNLRVLKIGSAVNLERSLRADGRLGGHFVTGHIDGTGTIKRWEKRGGDWLLDISAPAHVARYLIFKGAIAVDGISLTVAEVRKRTLRIWIIPHTYEVTALRERAVGDPVNLEADILGKYVEQFMRKSV